LSIVPEIFLTHLLLKSRQRLALNLDVKDTLATVPSVVGIL
jgi:hypothetical protein